MSYVNKYTESATYSGGNLIFTLNDGLTYSVNIPSGSTPSLQQVLNVGNTASNNIILTGTNSIQSNNGNGYFYFDDATNQTLVGQNTPGPTYSQLRLSNASAILQSSQGSNNLRSINMNSSGIDISVQSSTVNNKIFVDTSNVWIIGTGSFYKLPNTDGLSGQVLTTNGAGQASWATASSLLSSRLTAWNAYNTNGLLVQTSATTWTNRTITSGGNPITITNGDGISGNPIINFNGSYTGTFTASTALVTSGNITAGDFIQNSSASIQTTNNTLTTLKTIPTVSETIYHIEVTVIGGLTTTNNGYTMKMFLSYKNNGGTVTQIGFGNFFQDSDWSGSAPIAAPIISGTNILIKVTGLAGTNIDWYCSAIVRSAPMGVI